MEYDSRRTVLAFFVAPLAAVLVSAAVYLVQSAASNHAPPDLTEWAGAILVYSAFALPVAYVATLLGGVIALTWSRIYVSPITRRHAVVWGSVGGLLAGLTSVFTARSLSWPGDWPLPASLILFLGIAVPTGIASGLLFQVLLGSPEAAG